mmetsp:Transcript_34722/g.81776  ORF Transcript_34722/g.81776 Transcript_34722/m.81776 type:complete len:210 (+) Transcript_34722:415-1044(+)
MAYRQGAAELPLLCRDSARRSSLHVHDLRQDLQSACGPASCDRHRYRRRHPADLLDARRHVPRRTPRRCGVADLCGHQPWHLLRPAPQRPRRPCPRLADAVSVHRCAVDGAGGGGCVAPPRASPRRHRRRPPTEVPRGGGPVHVRGADLGGQGGRHLRGPLQPPHLPPGHRRLPAVGGGVHVPQRLPQPAAPPLSAPRHRRRHRSQHRR